MGFFLFTCTMKLSTELFELVQTDPSKQLFKSSSLQERLIKFPSNQRKRLLSTILVYPTPSSPRSVQVASLRVFFSPATDTDVLNATKAETSKSWGKF